MSVLRGGCVILIILGLMAGIPLGLICVLIYLLSGLDARDYDYRPWQIKVTFLGFVLCTLSLCSHFWLLYESMWAFALLGGFGWFLTLSAITGWWHEFEDSFDSERQVWWVMVGIWFFGSIYPIAVWNDLVKSFN